MKSDLHAVILAGGVGSRFWPMSRTNKPKQFLDFLGTGRSLIQMTFDRLSQLAPSANIWVVCHEDYLDLIQEQLPLIKTENILLEPSRKNTAPCIAFAASAILLKNPNANMLVAPADHLITNESQFVRDIEEAEEFLNQNNCLITLGIQASRPDTGYGYIQFNQEESNLYEIYPVKQFVEKPNHNTAVEYLRQGNYLWNSGMFLWKAAEIVNQIKIHLPELAESFSKYKDQSSIQSIYSNCRSISIDVGIMEKAESVYVKTVDFGWSDLGTFGSIYSLSDHDNDGNVVHANMTVLHEVSDCMIKNEEKKLIAIHGLKNFIVINTKDVLMICDMQEEQEIKKLVSDVENHFGKELI